MNKAALYALSYGLYVVGVKDGEKLGGCVINTALQVTSKPPRVSIAVSKDNYTHQMVTKAKHFTISVLAQDAQMPLIGGFGFQSSKDVDKFNLVNHREDGQGAPYLGEGSVAYFSCDVFSEVDLGTHTLFIADVAEGEVMAQGEAMTYDYYRNVKNGTVPKNAPTYREPEAHKKGYKCSVCGYETDAETLPDDYRCPICSQPKSVFKKM